MSLWLYNSQRTHFFRKEDGRFTHCYRLGRYMDIVADYNQWSQVPIPRRRKLKEVPSESEIEYQLTELSGAGFPPAGFFKQYAGQSHPRRNRWSDLHPLDFVPKHWAQNTDTGAFGIDFVSGPYIAENWQYPESPVPSFPTSRVIPKEKEKWTEVLNQMKHLGYKNWDCGCKRNAAIAIMTRNYHL